mgnify:FL=1|jgi:hypothetical protein
MSKSIEVDGQELSIGDGIGFKDDYEMCGEIVAINKPWIDIVSCDSNTDEERFYTKHVDRCWAE